MPVYDFRNLFIRSTPVPWVSTNTDTALPPDGVGDFDGSGQTGGHNVLAAYLAIYAPAVHLWGLPRAAAAAAYPP